MGLTHCYKSSLKNIYYNNSQRILTYTPLTDDAVVLVDSPVVVCTMQLCESAVCRYQEAGWLIVSAASGYTAVVSFCRQ